MKRELYRSLRDISREEMLSPGGSLCAGCGGLLTLRLVHKGEEIPRRRDADSFVIGRDAEGDLLHGGAHYIPGSRAHKPPKAAYRSRAGRRPAQTGRRPPRDSSVRLRALRASV